MLLTICANSYKHIRDVERSAEKVKARIDNPPLVPRPEL